MARTLIIDDPTADDDGRVLAWDHTREVANLIDGITPAGGAMTGDLTFTGSSIVLTASDDSQWRLVVGTDGALTTEAVV